MAMTRDDIVAFGKKVNELKQLPLFQEVIIEGYLGQAQSIAISFDDTPEQRETLVAISHLVRWMRDAENEAIKLLDNHNNK